jgi:alginate O-acetyltransferase complex protein AlgJ
MIWRSEERERQAARELGHTEIGRGLAAVLVAAFLATILAVPALQLAAAPPDARPLVAGIPSECTLERFERGIEDASVVGRRLLPRLQALLTGALGAGNEQVYPGRDGWLYHRPGVDYVAGRGFLEPEVLRARRLATDACDGTQAPDPLAAIAGFGEALAARGIRLMVLPTPVKAVVAPEHLAARAGRGPLQNPSFARFAAELGARGVAVFDPAPLLLARGSYLATDTHWRPEAMDRVARAVAERLEGSGWLGPARGAYRRTAVPARHFGDLVLLLNLPAGQRLFAPEEVATQRVAELGSPERPWRPTRGAEVLLLGDSFSNVYSDPGAFRSERLGPEYGWGEAAGFAEQLSFHLTRPVDRIVRNAGGAHAARADLARELAREAEAGRDRLAGVRVVLWQFAVRELSEGDWKEIPLPERRAAAAVPAAAAAPAAGARIVRATLAARAEPPRPGSVPYRDALIALHLRDVETVSGEPAPGEVLAYVYGLRDDRRVEAALGQPGARVELRLEPFDDEAVQARVGSLNRVELEDLELLALPAFFGESPAPGGTP